MSAFLGRVSQLAALVLVIAGCGSSEPIGIGGGGINNGTSQAEYDLALKKWQTSGPVHYRIVVAQTCECSTDMQRATRVTVRRVPGPTVTETIESVVDAATSQAVGQDRLLAAKSVDGLLVLIAQALALNPQDARITYDSALGYPISVNIDLVTSITGDEVVYKVTSFEILP
jgi:hypothetical protein